MKYKSLSLKNFEITETGEFTCYANVFGVVDMANEVTMPGTFADTIKYHAENGTMPKFRWMHEDGEILGGWDYWEEDDTGLLMKGHFNLETELGREKYALVKRGDLDSFSIGYIVDEEYEREDGAIVLAKVSVHEVSLVDIACNDKSLLIDIKSAPEQEEVQEETATDHENESDHEEKSGLNNNDLKLYNWLVKRKLSRICK